MFYVAIDSQLINKLRVLRNLKIFMNLYLHLVLPHFPTDIFHRPKNSASFHNTHPCKPFMHIFQLTKKFGMMYYQVSTSITKIRTIQYTTFLLFFIVRQYLYNNAFPMRLFFLK
ncbi:hypothetical protein EDEG_03639 [Edhazardia aedis USNM 41457]|uniref:Uncharacterized protein n=1 Tax=Edhazardia aedis (strain USNM 41457) TaxID=1003232 RepID=J9DH05_EDHAE|nr:hypothetical protein EDEG_03639 [Edhazardia aedis USNM 41457]|eukprot:EJW01885.1 hypothetical protein EDEG_03639 [Edhazardia aedis USNM 41457]